MKKIEKVISRDFRVVAMYGYHIALTAGQKEWFGWSYSDLIFYFHDGYSDLMLPTEEFHHDFITRILQKMKKNPKWFNKEYDKFINTTEKFYTFFSDSKKKVHKIPRKKLIVLYNEFYDFMKGYYGPYLLMKWFPIFLENNPALSKKYKKEKKLSIECRKKAEQIFPNVRAFIDSLLEGIKNDVPYEKSLVNFFTKKEFFDFIKKGELPMEAELTKRSKGFIFSRKGIILTDGEPENARKILANLGYAYEIKLPNNLKEFKGQTAFAGKVFGFVRRIMIRSKIASIKKGEILVASMTTPEYMPAMKKAAGFVTDEGGITCHAAIVARELKKPTIIGTKIATKVLKNGMIVEVDANHGVVKIIKWKDLMWDRVQGFKSRIIASLKKVL